MRPGKSAAAAARRALALDLRIEGKGYRDIGARLGVHWTTAWKDVQAALAESGKRTAERADTLRDIELKRCEALTDGLWTKARQGDERAVRALVLLMERRARLLGLDVKPSLDVTSGGEPVHVSVVHHYEEG